MRKVLLVSGDLASGKTTFAKKIAKEFNLPLYTKDEFKEQLSETLPYKTKEDNQRLSVLAIDKLIDTFNQIAISGADVILEANFHTESIERINEIAKKNDYDLLTIVLRGDIDILYKRYVNRNVNEKRHPVHLYNELDDYDKFKDYLERYHNEEVNTRKVIVGVNSLDYQDNKGIISIIQDFLK